MGRPKGSLNNNKRLLREALEEKLGCSIPEHFARIISSGVPTKQEIDILLGMLPYCYPKFAAVEAPDPDTQETGEAVCEDLLNRLLNRRSEPGPSDKVYMTQNSPELAELPGSRRSATDR